MSVGFKAVQWNRRKLVYDATLIVGVALFIATYMAVGALNHPPAAARPAIRPTAVLLRMSPRACTVQPSRGRDRDCQR